MNERRSLQLLAEKYEQVLETNHHISDDIKNQIINTFRQGVKNNIPDDTNIAKLAQRHNISPSVVNYIIRQSGNSAGPGYTQIGSKSQSTAQKIPPDQIKHINNLIATKDSEGVFEHGALVIAKMVNDYIDVHPELNWYKPILATRMTNYIKKWEEKNIPGETRMNLGVKRSNGVTLRRKTGLPNHKGTRQTKFGPLGPNDPSQITAVGRAQDIDDQAFLVKRS